MRLRTSAVLEQLRQYESRNVTFLDPDGTWPIVWQRARGNFVWDIEGKRYLDLTAAFGVAAAGHANPRVVRAGQQQMSSLLHAMGDVHPHALKAKLAAELSHLTFERWNRQRASPARRAQSSQSYDHGKVIFCNSGFEAVEAALKTALLATGRKGVIAFEGAYHGLGYGTLNVTEREHFRAPFLPQLGGFSTFVAFPAPGDPLERTEASLRHALRGGEVGAVLVEPVQTRGGIRIPPRAFLSMLRDLCDAHGALLVLDEIYTGFGRTGRWFACEHAGVVPDLICLGKALTGGFPLSACVGRATVMDAWPISTGEAIHTSTFLGHPVGCAMALAQIDEIRTHHLPDRAAALGRILQRALGELRPPPGFEFEVRISGLLAGVQVKASDGTPGTTLALDVIQRMLRAGYILLPEGEHADVIAVTPPLTITENQLNRTVTVLQRQLEMS